MDKYFKAAEDSLKSIAVANYEKVTGIKSSLILKKFNQLKGRKKNVDVAEYMLFAVMLLMFERTAEKINRTSDEVRETFQKKLGNRTVKIEQVQDILDDIELEEALNSVGFMRYTYTTEQAINDGVLNLTEKDNMIVTGTILDILKTDKQKVNQIIEKAAELLKTTKTPFEFKHELIKDKEIVVMSNEVGGYTVMLWQDY